MAIIYSYPQKTTPAGGDFLVITDSEQPAPNKNRTKSLTVDNLANYVVTSTSGITGSGTLNTVAMFTPNGQAIGDSIITQASLGQGVTINGGLNVVDDLNVTGSIETNSSLTVQSISTFNDDATFESVVNINDALYDQNSSPGTAGQVLSSTGAGNVEWIDNTAPGTVTGSGTLNTIAMFTPDGSSVGDSLISQTIQSPVGTANNIVTINGGNGNTNQLSVEQIISTDINVIDTLTVETIQAQGTGAVYLRGGVQIGDGSSDILNIFSETAFFGKIKDSTFSTGTAGQILVSDANSNVEWKSYSDSGATFLGWARYDGTPSFSNGSEVTVTDGNFIDPPVSLVTNQIIDPYVNGSSGKFVFTSNDLNAVYCLTAVFKASAANANQTHVDVNFISGATDYERLSKSIAFYKGNDQVDNFHEMFQFYVDSDLITYGLQPRLYAQGGSVKFGDVIFFIQKQQQPAI